MISGTSQVTVSDAIALGQKKLVLGTMRHTPLRMSGTTSLRAATLSTKPIFRGWLPGQ